MPKNDYLGPGKLKPKTALTLVCIILLYVVIRLLIIAPKFFVWLGGIFIISTIALKIYDNMTRAVFHSCPKCGELMNMFGKVTVFKGAFNKDGGKPFSALSMQKTQCPKCDTFYLQLRYANQIIGDIATDAWVRQPSRSMINFDSNHGDSYIEKISRKEMTEKQYQELLNRLKQEVVENNRKAGFPDNPKDVELK